MPEETSPSRSLTADQRVWLEHLKAWQEQDVTLKTYAKTHGLFLSGLYTAKRLFKRRGIGRGREAGKANPPRLTLVPVRVTQPPLMALMSRVRLPNGIVVVVMRATSRIR